MVVLTKREGAKVLKVAINTWETDHRGIRVSERRFDDFKVNAP